MGCGIGVGWGGMTQPFGPFAATPSIHWPVVEICDARTATSSTNAQAKDVQIRVIARRA